MAEVRLVNIKKVYPHESKKERAQRKGAAAAQEKKVNLQITDEGVVAVQEFNLDIADKEFIVLVGPSGCGKSTTLRMIAGLEEISGGELYIDGKVMNDVAPKDRDIAMVFQNYALYPHMTVYDNMAFSLKLKKTPKDEIDRKVRALDMGANDYVTKPFSTAELLARIRSCLRSSRNSGGELVFAGREFCTGGLEIDYDSRRVRYLGTEIHFTQNEYNILTLLARYSGKVLTYQTIIRNVWGAADSGSIKKLQVNMANIRKKLGIVPGEDGIIVNELGVGYRIRI